MIRTTYTGVPGSMLRSEYTVSLLSLVAVARLMVPGCILDSDKALSRCPRTRRMNYVALQHICMH